MFSDKYMNRRISLSHCKENNSGIRQFRKYSNFGIISDNPGQNQMRHLSHFTKIVKTCHKPKKLPPCPPKSMLSVGGFVDRCFKG